MLCLWIKQQHVYQWIYDHCDQFRPIYMFLDKSVTNLSAGINNYHFYCMKSLALIVCSDWLAQKTIEYYLSIMWHV